MEKKFKRSESVNQASMTKSFNRPLSCETIINLRQLATEESGNRNFVFNSLIKIISSKETLILAYELIKSNPGSMALGPSGETLDSLTAEWIEKTSLKLKSGKYVFTPPKRVLMPKDKNTTRPLDIINSREKIVQKAILLVLEAVYEPIFSPHSHGCREGRGNHTALKEIKTTFSGANWVIETDISRCFENIDHAILLNILKKRIRCEKTLALIKNALSCGYVFGKTVRHPKIGISQGSVLSPILCNIYLDELDQFLNKQKENFNSTVNKRPRNLVLRRFVYSLNKKSTSRVERQEIKAKMLECKSTLNINYKRLFFVRYVDDFFVGVAGTYQEALYFKNLIENFLLDSLKMELSKTKTKVTKFSSNKAFYLGVFIRGTYRKVKKVTKYVRKGKFITSDTTPRVSFHAPIKVLLEDLTDKGFFKRKQCKFIPTSIGRVVNFDHGDIIKYYNSIIRGILSYFSFVDNKKSLGSIVHGLKMSAARTLALKYKSRSVKPIFTRYGKLLTCPNTKAEIYIPKTFARDQIFLIDVKKAEDVIKIKWNKKLTHTNLLKSCCVCGSTENIHMHHLKHVRDLRSKYSDKRIDFFTLQMRAINRKQLPLCKAHHNAVHNSSLTLDEKKSFLKAIKNS